MRAALVVPVLLAAAGCDTAVHHVEVSEACLEATGHSDYAWLRDNVFQPSCASFVSCHMGSRPPGGLNLQTARAYAQLVGVPATSISGWQRVVPFRPQESYLLVKLGVITNVDLGKDGTYMPPNSPLICQEKLDAVQRWIASGAPSGTPDAGAPDAPAEMAPETVDDGGPRD